jgi:hypothetical protein
MWATMNKKMAMLLAATALMISAFAPTIAPVANASLILRDK